GPPSPRQDDRRPRRARARLLLPRHRPSRAHSRRGASMNRIGTGVAFAALALAIWTWQARSAEQGTPPAAVLPVVAHTVRLTSGYDVDEMHSGRVVARRTSALGFERGGRLEDVLADDGDRVDAGDV